MALDHMHVTADDLLTRYATLFPAGAILRLRTGAPPGAENAATGTLLCEITLPATPWATAATGSVAKNGTWSGVGDAGAGAGLDAGHYRLSNVGDTHRLEGTVTGVGGGGDMIADNVSIASGQAVTIVTYTLSLV